MAVHGCGNSRRPCKGLLHLPLRVLLIGATQGFVLSYMHNFYYLFVGRWFFFFQRVSLLS